MGTKLQVDTRFAPSRQIGIKSLNAAFHALVERVRAGFELHHGEGVGSKPIKTLPGPLPCCFACRQPVVNGFHVGGAIKHVELVGKHVRHGNAVITHHRHTANGEIRPHMKAQAGRHPLTQHGHLTSVVQANAW